MRALNILERQLISRFLNVDSSSMLSVLGNALDPSQGAPCLPNDAYIDLSTPNSMICFIKPTANSAQMEEQVLMLLTTTIFLVKELEALGLLQFAGNTVTTTLGIMPHGVNNYNSTNFIDTDLGASLWPYTQKRFWVSEELRELVKRDFHSKEEVWYKDEIRKGKTELKLTRIALAVSFAAVVVSIVAPKFDTTKVEFSTTPVEITLSASSISAFNYSFEKNQAAMLKAVSNAHALSTQLQTIAASVENVSNHDRDSRVKQSAEIINQLQAISHHLRDLLSEFKTINAHNKAISADRKKPGD